MSDQQFVLRWHYHETTLLHNLPSLLESDILTDVTLSVGAHFVKAHRIVLAMCSVYFLQLFQGMGGLQHPVIVLHNVSVEDIKAVLSFIYRGQCIVTKEQLPSLLSVAKLLKIQGLCDMKVPEKTTDDSINVDKEKTTNLEDNFLASSNKNNEQIYDLSKDSREGKDESLFLKPQNKTTSNNNNREICNLLNEPINLNVNHSNWENAVPVVQEVLHYKPDYERNFTMPVPVLKKVTKDTSETCKCFLCGKYLSNQYNLRVHMETHEEAYHACQSCPHVSRSRDALRKHVSYRHPEEYHTRKRKKVEHV